MDFTQLDWLDNWQPLQEFATSSLTDLDLSDIQSPIEHIPAYNEGAEQIAEQHHSGRPGMPDQSFYSGDHNRTQFTDFNSHSIEAAWSLDALWAAAPNCGLSEPSKVNSGFFEQPSGTTMVENHLPITIHSVPDRSFDLPKPRKFPQNLGDVVSNFIFAFASTSGNNSNYRCSWPRCGSTDIFIGRNAIQEHLEKVHVATVQAAWPGCKWPDCQSKKDSFTTGKRLEDHLQNIHIEPLICPEPGCPNKKPFGKPGDLERHRKSKHANGSMPYKCPHTSCPKPIQEFARKDKLREHLRNWHGNFECLNQGCHRGPGNGFRTEEQLLSHTRTAHKTLQAGCPLTHCETSNTAEAAFAVLLDENFEAIHGDYNCELGICGQTQSSEFTPYTLKKHLIKDHDISSSEAVGLVDALIKAGECALKDSQLVRLGWAQGQRGLQSIHTRKTFMECLSCSSVTANIPDPSL
ncbi:uncharacterized protein PAC_14366 [Phialocephala subalpina]|uniref:C2H2-type domain-containing protein n=1 Tax=Phialocephala subalpina TaxID=576137 RepID=A0A1L7XHI2_9HELO|nr:uncharacterized protein PAC_14366 [Phialocephala subalpina]